MSAELNSDKPISREEDDLLGRYPLAYRISDLINNLGDGYKDSVVIGVEGEWGSGKSSFINLILNKLDPKRLGTKNPTNSSAENMSLEQGGVAVAYNHDIQNFCIGS